LRAERKAGQLLTLAAEAGERHKGKGQSREVLQSRGTTVSIPKLSDLGITADQSSSCQKLSKMPLHFKIQNMRQITASQIAADERTAAQSNPRRPIGVS